MKSLLGAVLDQAATSLSALIVTIAVARLASPTEFGLIAALQLVIAISVQGYRQTMGASLLRAGAMSVLDGAASVLTFALLLVAVCTGVGLALGHVVGPYTAAALIAAAGGALLQERGRLSLQARRRNLASGGIGAICLTATGAIAAGCMHVQASPWWPWLFTGVATAGIWAAVLRAEALPRLRGWLSIASAYSSEWRSGGTAFAMQSAMWMGPVWILGAFRGSVSVAGLRGSQSLIAIAQQLPQALFPVFMVSRHNPRGTWRRVGAWAMLQGLGFGTVAIFFQAWGSLVGPLLLGRTWTVASPVLQPMLLAAFMAAISLGLEIELRHADSTRTIMRVRSILIGPQLLTYGLATWAYGLSGTVWSSIAGQAAVLVGLALAVIARSKSAGQHVWGLGSRA